jgi:zinc/manganese transport system substrate-binding protein
VKFETLILLVSASLTVSLGAGQAQAQDGKLKIVTTLNCLRHLAQEVGGDRVVAVALASPQQDPHYVTPTLRMNQLATNADLFIENRLSLDLWQQNVVDASGNPRIQSGNPGHLIATNSIPVKELPTEVSRAWGNIHRQGNPHVWLDPINVRIITQNIAERLVRLDPTNSALYQKNLEQYKVKLDAAMFGDELLKVIGKSADDILSRKTKNGELAGWLRSRYCSRVR